MRLTNRWESRKEYAMNKPVSPEQDEQRIALFPWMCRKVGGIFLLQGFEPPYICPQCGTTDAFESGDCRRIFAEEILPRERRQS
jgi:rubrerythrin